MSAVQGAPIAVARESKRLETSKRAYAADDWAESWLVLKSDVRTPSLREALTLDGRSAKPIRLLYGNYRIHESPGSQAGKSRADQVAKVISVVGGVIGWRAPGPASSVLAPHSDARKARSPEKRGEPVFRTITSPLATFRPKL